MSYCSSKRLFPLQLTNGFFSCTEFFSFMKSYLLIAGLNSQANGVLFRNSFLMSISRKVLLMFSCSSFSISGFVFRSLSIWSLFLYKVIDTNLVSLFCLWAPSFPAPLVEDPFHFSSIGFWHLGQLLNGWSCVYSCYLKMFYVSISFKSRKSWVHNNESKLYLFSNNGIVKYIYVHIFMSVIHRDKMCRGHKSNVIPIWSWASIRHGLS